MDCIVTLFGIALVPAIFQCAMETLPKWLLMVLVYFDEILVPGKTEQECLTKLVLKCLNSAGIKLKKEKCAFCLPQVEYVRHISAEGLYPEASKVKAIKEASKPLSLYKPKLKSFLGLVSYYAQFLPDSANIPAPLYKLLRNSKPWQWDKEQQVALRKLEQC